MKSHESTSRTFPAEVLGALEALLGRSGPGRLVTPTRVKRKGSLSQFALAGMPKRER